MTAAGPATMGGRGTKTALWPPWNQDKSSQTGKTTLTRIYQAGVTCLAHNKMQRKELLRTHTHPSYLHELER